MTLRAGRLPSLRNARLFRIVQQSLSLSSRADFRVLEFSVQRDHVHLIVEAEGTSSLRSGIQGLAIRIARSLNRALRRVGRVWSDRYHVRMLRTPREVRHALVYALANWRKHLPAVRGIDPCSSARWFAGWRNRGWTADGTCPVARPRTWLAGVGWRRLGLIDVDEAPRPARRR